MYTARFLKVPIKVYDAEIKELTNQEILEDVWVAINPMEISSYKPAREDNATEFTETYLTLKNGSEFYIFLTTDEFEELLNNHQK